MSTRIAIRILTAIHGRALDTFAGWMSKASRKVVGHESDAVAYGASVKFTMMVVSTSMGSPFRRVGV
jgi:hypothetical protein